MTPDPMASGEGLTPQSWNRYAYVIGDPANRYDPLGLETDEPGFCELYPWDKTCNKLPLFDDGPDILQPDEPDPEKTTSFTLQNTVSGTMSIPDFVDRTERLIVEVKNVSYLSYTRQINDMAQWAKANNYGPLQLWVREGATISSNVYKAQEQGLLVLRPFTWP